MTDVLDYAALIDAAQEAIVVGDYRKAERLLRDAAAAQEATLGPDHPELARTLHDYAFICERTNNLAEAEQSYRRAHAIAVKALGPRDPFVTESVKTLVTFCAAHAVPIWKPPAAAPLSGGTDQSHTETNELDLYPSEAATTKVETQEFEEERKLSAEQNDTARVDASQIDLASIDTASIDTAPIDTAPINTGQIDTGQINTDQSNTDQSNTAPLETPLAAFDADAFEPTPPEPAPTQPDPLEADRFEIAFFDSAPLEPPVEAAPIETLTLEEAPPFEADPFEAGPLETGQFDTPPMAATTDRYAGIDPVVPSAVPVVRVRVARRNTDTTGRAIALVVGAAVVIAAALFAVRWSRSSSPGLASDQPAITQPSPAPAAPPAIEELSARAEAPALPPVAAVPSNAAPAQPLEAAPPPVTPAPPPRPREPLATAAPITVLNARLCRTITKQGSPDWKCTPAEGDLRPGNYFFYTRLLATSNTKVEHRWYRNDREQKVVPLSITASPGVGYRTISSTNISADRPGNWRVEVRAADGTVLQEHAFVITSR